MAWSSHSSKTARQDRCGRVPVQHGPTTLCAYEANLIPWKAKNLSDYLAEEESASLREVDWGEEEIATGIIYPLDSTDNNNNNN